MADASFDYIVVGKACPMLPDQRPDMCRDHHDDQRGQGRRDRPIDEIERRLTRAMR